ncbi:MAG TPA: OPT/YSL family transporter, partial [Candidatus Acidoferrales bacterium]|nr:OPT/YSL family transporter [Candidatus Acidoferrales bacterium]
MSKAFKPFVPAESREAEMTFKAVASGVLLAAVFGAANAYLAMRAGQTIATTIPAAVIAIALFRLPFFRGGVLEQNVSRTAASVGEALVAGAAFTIPAFLLTGVPIWPDFRGHYWESTLMLLAGGLLGVFFIILLRRPLCVDSDLPFPEATACAEIVKAGQHGSTDAPRYVFGAMGVAGALQLLTNSLGFQIFRDTAPGFIEFPRAVISHFGPNNAPLGKVMHTGGMPYATPLASPAMMGIGYIIGPQLAAINFSGTVMAWWLLIPLALFFDPDLPQRLNLQIPPGGVVPWDVISTSVWYNVVRPIAVGTMLVSAVFTLYTMRESLFASVRGALAARGHVGGSGAPNRLDQDIPLGRIFIAIVALVLPIGVIYFHFTGRPGASILLA